MILVGERPEEMTDEETRQVMDKALPEDESRHKQRKVSYTEPVSPPAPIVFEQVTITAVQRME